MEVSKPDAFHERLAYISPCVSLLLVQVRMSSSFSNPPPSYFRGTSILLTLLAKQNMVFDPLGPGGGHAL